MKKMNDLVKLIDKYLEIGREQLSYFFEEKGIKKLKSNSEWLVLELDQNGFLKRHNIRYFKHGFGIDFEDKNWKISIEFGNEGELNGFDSWNLFDFMKSNNVRCDFKNDKEIEKLLVKGIENGIFIKKKELYFKTDV